MTNKIRPLNEVPEVVVDEQDECEPQKRQQQRQTVLHSSCVSTNPPPHMRVVLPSRKAVVLSPALPDIHVAVKAQVMFGLHQ